MSAFLTVRSILRVRDFLHQRLQLLTNGLPPKFILKVNGSGRYGIDAAVSGMIYARPKIPPTRYDSKVISLDDSAARRLPGYIKSLALDDPSGSVPGCVMVYADTFTTANRAADLVKVKWESGPSAKVSERMG